MNSIVQEKISEFFSEPIPQGFLRNLSLGAIQPPKKENYVNIVVGVRRCGKTYRLYQEMHRIIDAGYPKDSLLYFNFEDERLKPYDPHLLSDVIDTFYSMRPQAKETGAFFFFDEIQVIPDWGTFLRRIVDSLNVTIYVTGSSSKMLSLELATEFRGRSLSHEMFPLSFSEFVNFTRQTDSSKDAIHPDQTDQTAPAPFSGKSIAYTSQEKALLRNSLNSYLLRGGFPAVQALEPSDAVMMLQDYANRTIAYDIIERYNVSNPRIASSFLSRCLATSAREISINKIHGAFKSQGAAVSRETLAQLLSYFEEAYLLFSLREFSRTLADNPRTASKVYAIDQGMASAFSPSAADDEGQRLETAVFLKLRRIPPSARQGSIARLLVGEKSPKHEVDFITGDTLFQTVYQLIQVSCSLKDEKTRKRKIRALEAAMEMYSISESLIVTLDEEETFQGKNGTIHVVPAWKWLLD